MVLQRVFGGKIISLKSVVFKWCFLIDFFRPDVFEPFFLVKWFIKILKKKKIRKIYIKVSF